MPEAGKEGLGEKISTIPEKIKQRASAVIAPLTTRERLVYSVLALGFISLLVAPRITADVGDEGTEFAVVATQCSITEGWLYPNQITGQPSAGSSPLRSDITSDNAAVWIGETGSVVCSGYSPSIDHAFTENAIQIIAKSVNATPEEVLADAQSSINADTAAASLQDGAVLTERIDDRPTILEPNLYNENAVLDLDALLVVSVSGDSGQTWQQLHAFGSELSAASETRFNIAIPPQYTSNPDQLQVRLETTQDDDVTLIFVESLTWTYTVGADTEVTTRLIDEDSGETLVNDRPVLNQSDDLSVEFGLKDPNDGIWQGLRSRASGLVGDSEQAPITVTTSVLDDVGEVISEQTSEAAYEGVDLSNTQTWKASLDVMPPSADPGLYTLRFDVNDPNGGSQTITQDFLWGVLALNTDRDAYRAGESADIHMSVLDERGATICNADVSLVIESPSETATLTTNSGIEIGDLCQEYGSHIEPDYAATYDFLESGEHTLTLTATTQNGSFTITESIEVSDEQSETAPVRISRRGPTRIYPVLAYPMFIEITAIEDYTGTITESVPIEFELDSLEFATPYDEAVIVGDAQTLSWNVSLRAGETEVLGYSFDAPDISPEFYLLGPAEASITEDDEPLIEARQWQIAGDALDVFRVTTYELQSGEFTGTTYTLSLNNNLAANYFTSIQGMSEATGSRPQNEDFARISGDPHSNFASTTAANELELTRGASSNNWIGSVHVVECLLNCDTQGFELSEVVESSLVAGSGNTQQTVNETLAANYTSNTVPFGGHWGGGLSTSGTDVNAYSTTSGAKLSLVNTDELQIDRYGAENRAPSAATFTTYITEWGSSWTVQTANVTGTAAGAGIDITGEYNTASISSVTRDNTFVYGTGFASDDGLGDGFHGQAWTLGDGVNQNATETSVAVGAEGAQLLTGRDMQLYVLENSTLAVDHRFRSRGDAGAASGFQELDLTVDTALSSEAYDNASTDVQYTEGNRLPIFSSTSTGTGQAYSRPVWGYRLDADTNVNYWRAYSGQNVTGWFQVVDFGDITVAAPEVEQLRYRWRDDTTDLNTSGGFLAAENTNISPQNKGDTVRLRLKVANPTVDDDTVAKSYELQFADKNGYADCSLPTVWAGVTDSGSDALTMAATDNIDPDGESTTAELLTNGEGYTYINGEGRESADNTSAIGPLLGNETTELEFAIQLTDNAVTGKTYCLRLYNVTGSSELDTYTVFPEITADSATLTLPNGLGEVGTFASAANGAFTTVNFTGTYTTPVVVGVTNTHDAQNALEFEADNVTATTADIRVCESEGATTNGCDTHASETVAYMVIDAAVAATTPGIAAGTTSLSGGEPGTVTGFGTTFGTTPYVFSNVNTVNSTEFPISVVISSVTTSSYTVNICDHLLGSNDNCDTSHTPAETVGWVAIEPDNEPFTNLFESNSQVIDTDNGTWVTINFTETFASAPAVLLASQTDTGGQDVEIEGVNAVSTTQADIRFCEIDTLDNCDSHSGDTVAWMAIETGEFTTDISLDQDGYRIYENVDSVTPTVPLNNENTPAAGVDSGDVVRLRIASQNGENDLAASALDLTLQYAQASDCSAAGTWLDVGGTGSGTIWRGFDNATPADGATIASSLLDGGTNVLQSYEESNDSVLNPTLVPAESRAEWDWVIENNGATANTDYCFRMVTASGSQIHYTNYPQITTATGTKLLIMYDGSASGGSVIDDFDATIDGTQWNSTIGGTATTDCQSLSGNAFQFEAASGERELESIDIDASSGGTISFYLYAPSAADETAACEQPEAADDLELQYATDGTGTAWTTISTYDGSAYESLTFVEETIPVGAQTATTRFRLVQPNYSAGDFDHWAVDEVVIVSRSIPSGWTCVSCTGSDAYFQNFARGEGTYGGTGGSDTHAHTGSASVAASTASATDTFAGSTVSDVGHTHTASGVSFTPASNLPVFNEMIILESDLSAESITTIPEDGVIIFTEAVPAGFSSYSTINGEFVRGGASELISGGSNTHTHQVTATVDAAGGGTEGVDATPTTVQQDDFDPGIDGTQWNDTTGMSADTFCAASSGNALHSSGGTDDVAETIDVDVSAGGTITFDLFIAPANVGACNAAEAGEDVLLEYSTDGGGGWNTIATYDEASYATMTEIVVPIPAGAETASTRFRWTQVTNSGNNFDHWVIDDLTIDAEPSGTTPAADASHTHSVAGTTASASNEPPYIEVILGIADSDVAIPSGMVGMFSGPHPANWNCLSCSSGQILYQRFFKPAASYGATGGSESHSLADFDVTSSGPSSTTNGQPGTVTADDAHTHEVTFSSISNTNHLPPYINTVFASLNAPPNVPTNLDQETTGATSIVVDGWTNEASVVFTADATDPNNPEDIQLCVEVQPVGTPFTDIETLCGSLVTYSGTAVSVTVPIAALSDGESYHWQALLRDAAGDSSSWVSFGGNLETENDFNIDTTPPTGTVYDGLTAAVDVDLNTGALNELSANWVINSDQSGLVEYEVSVGTTPGATDVSGWSSAGTSTSTTIGSLSLTTTQPYYVNVRTTDNANNQSIISADGIFVAPTLTFSVSPTSVDLGNINGGSLTVTDTTTLTTSTNAYNGYAVRAFATGLLDSGPNTIGMFNGGTYVSPDEWMPGDTGYGYTSSDTSIQGVDKFNGGPCAGGGTPPCYSPWSLTAPGDIVADHTNTVSGSPISNENFTITHRVTADGSQNEGVYTTTIVYTITAIY